MRVLLCGRHAGPLDHSRSGIDRTELDSRADRTCPHPLCHHVSRLKANFPVGGRYHIPNVAPPTGWQNNTFDDSTWGQAATIYHTPPDTNDGIWAENPQVNDAEETLYREHFQMPAATVLTATVFFSNLGQLLEAYINGHALSPIDTTAGHTHNTLNVPPAFLNTPGDNVIACRCSAVNHTAPPPNAASVSFLVQYTT